MGICRTVKGLLAMLLVEETEDEFNTDLKKDWIEHLPSPKKSFAAKLVGLITDLKIKTGSSILSFLQQNF